MSSSSGSYISTDVMGMSKAESVMEEIYADLTGAVNALTEQQSTLAANWTGEASSNFGQALTAFIDDFNKINSALSGMVGAMGGNASVYASTSSATTAMSQAFTNSTSGMLTPASLDGAISASGLTGF